MTSISLVSPAWGRFDVTRLVLTQRRWLAAELAPRGVDVRSVIVADDDNLDIARELGFETVEMDNRGLGGKFNAGFRYAASQGADWLVHVGSDDWVHPDWFLPLLNPLEPKPVLAGRQLAFVDLLSGRLTRGRLGGSVGAIPWAFPREVLERVGFEPIRPSRMRGIDGDLLRGLRSAGVKAEWVFHDPSDVARVDFKSDTNINTFQSLPISLKGRRADAWSLLGAHYPPDLVGMARDLHMTFRGRGAEAEAA